MALSLTCAAVDGKEEAPSNAHAVSVHESYAKQGCNRGIHRWSSSHEDVPVQQKGRWHVTVPAPCEQCMQLVRAAMTDSLRHICPHPVYVFLRNRKFCHQREQTLMICVQTRSALIRHIQTRLKTPRCDRVYVGTDIPHTFITLS